MDAEKFGRDVIRQIIGEPVKPISKFDYTHVGAIRDAAVRRFIGYPYRARIGNMVVDLDDSDKRALAFFEASIEIMNQLGLIESSRLERVMPRVFTEVQEVNNEQTYGSSFTQQKK